MRFALVLVVAAACGREAQQPAIGSGTGAAPADSAVVADAARTWPLPPRPAAPAELDWPERTYSELLMRFPAIADMDGLRIGELTIRAVKAQADATRLYVGAAHLGLGVLEDAWGQFTSRDSFGRAVWLDPTTGIRATYPVLHSPYRDTLELMRYAPVLDRIAAAPDGFIPGAGPLLGERAEALGPYGPWIVLDQTKPRSDRIVLLETIPSEWDEQRGYVAVHISKRTKRVWSVGVKTVLGPGVEQHRVHERLTQRWGVSRTFDDGARGKVTAWRKGAVDVETSTMESSNDRFHMRIDFEMRRLR